MTGGIEIEPKTVTKEINISQYFIWGRTGLFDIAVARCAGGRVRLQCKTIAGQ